MRSWTIVVLLLLLLAGWFVACQKGRSSDILTVYERSGGVAGLDDHLEIDESGEAVVTRDSERYAFTLDAERLSRLEERFQDVGFQELRKEYLPDQPGADRFEYVVTYKGHTVRTVDGAVPESLRPILDSLNRIVEERARS